VAPVETAPVQNQESNNVEIANNDVALSSGIPITETGTGGAWSLLSLILVVTGMFSSLVLIMVSLRKNRRTRDDDAERQAAQQAGQQATVKQYQVNGDKDKRQRDGKAMVVAAVAIVVAVIGLLVWLWVDNLNLPMVWINRWTPLIALIFIVHIVLVIVRLIVRKRDERADEKNATAGSQRAAVNY
jgi:flagellar biosynthesis/type III secretory pathway M-ring protein FliF/YscJ